MSYVYGQNLIQTVKETAHKTIQRVAATIDAFRPKILFKKSLTELPIVQKGVLETTGIENIIENIQTRIQTLREKVAGGTQAPAPSPAPSQGKASSLVIYESENKMKKTYLY